MQKAIELAVENVHRGGGPFGAVIVRGEEIIATGVNRVTARHDPTAHAEVNAIRAACERLGTFDLSGCEIYSSCEPCPMCLGAIYWAHLDKIYYGCNKHDAAEAGLRRLVYLRRAGAGASQPPQGGRGVAARRGAAGLPGMGREGGQGDVLTRAARSAPLPAGDNEQGPASSANDDAGPCRKVAHAAPQRGAHRSAAGCAQGRRPRG